MLFKDLISNLNLYRKRSAAPTGTGSVGVVKSKTASVQPILEIDGHTNKVQTVSFMHKNTNAFDIIFLVAVLFLIEAQDISHTRTATALNTHTQAEIFAQFLLILQFIQFLNSAFGKAYRCRFNSCTHLISN